MAYKMKSFNGKNNLSATPTHIDDVIAFNRFISSNIGTSSDYLEFVVEHTGYYDLRAIGGSSGWCANTSGYTPTAPVNPMLDGVALAYFVNPGCETLVKKVFLKKGDIIIMVVGASGYSSSSSGSGYSPGGGGGTFITKVVPSKIEGDPDCVLFTPANKYVVPLCIAGGAGGLHNTSSWGKFEHVLTKEQPTDIEKKYVGTSPPSTSYCGGGFRKTSALASYQAVSFEEGALGKNDGSQPGGYGSGGSSVSYAGGGGGYSGGTSGKATSDSGSATSYEYPSRSGSCYWLEGHEYITKVADSFCGVAEIIHSYVLLPIRGNDIKLEVDGQGLWVVLPFQPNNIEISMLYESDTTNSEMKKAMNIPETIFEESRIFIATHKELQQRYNTILTTESPLIISVKASFEGAEALQEWLHYDDLRLPCAIDCRSVHMSYSSFEKDYIEPGGTLHIPLKVSSFAIPDSEISSRITLPGNVVREVSVRNSRFMSIDLPDIPTITGVANLSTTLVDRLGISWSINKDIVVKPSRDMNIKLDSSSYDWGSLIDISHDDPYMGSTYTVEVLNGEEVIFTSPSLGARHKIPVPEVYSNTLRVKITPNSPNFTHKPQYSQVFSSTPIVWNSISIGAGVDDRGTVRVVQDVMHSSKVDSMEVSINGAYSMDYSEYTDTIDIPIKYFSFGDNTVDIKITDTQGNVRAEKTTIKIEGSISDIQKDTGAVIVSAYHAFVGSDGVESFHLANHITSNMLDIGIEEHEFVHHTKDAPSFRVVQKIVVNKGDNPDMVDNLHLMHKVTGAIE